MVKIAFKKLLHFALTITNALNTLLQLFVLWQNKDANFKAPPSTAFLFIFFEIP